MKTKIGRKQILCRLLIQVGNKVTYPKYHKICSSLFWPKKYTFMAKIDSFIDMTFMLINFLVQTLQLQCTENLIFYLFCQWKHEKTASKVGYVAKNCSNFQYCHEGPNLPKDSKRIRCIRIFIVLGIYSFGWESVTHHISIYRHYLLIEASCLNSQYTY